MTTIGDVVGRLVGWIERLMPAGDRRDALAAELAARFGADDAPVSAAGCAAVERCAWTVSRHVALIHEPGGSEPAAGPGHDPEWPPPDPDDVRRRAGAVSRVCRLADGTGVLRLDSLDAVGLAGPYLDAAFTLLRGADRIVLDLRANGGGDPATVALVAGRLLGDAAVKLSDVVYRDGVRQWWTPDLPPGTALRQDARVLVGPGTFSSGEALAYHLRSHGRVTVVGAATPGAADHVLPVRLAPTVLAHVPNASVVDAVTGGNWEGTGVVPDEPLGGLLGVLIEESERGGREQG
ncbi:S41 family peptidase [Virgisporangium aurantiacum]|uniref:Tail specific protease domain-containing protein n=1 Tax=Virgisporangium aurantiacum TaxID=175570 RepID=A0A8J3Z6H5_9ACTN|nr:S41 family peptidase [Virgisporangium aurantiacum]GIJ58319.1 hypothetical protein Vau01_058350 [Virgisporangium aurantiacum]